MANGPQTDKPRPLVVEDDPALAQAQAQAQALALSRRGVQVCLVTDGRSALGRATQENFAAIVPDLTLTEMDGLDLLRAIRLHGTRTPIIVCRVCGLSRMTICQSRSIWMSWRRPSMRYCGAAATTRGSSTVWRAQNR